MRPFERVKALAAAGAICVSALVGTAASAMTVPTNYEGTYAATSVTTNGNQHTVWLPHLFESVSAYWQFAPDDPEQVFRLDYRETLPTRFVRTQRGFLVQSIQSFADSFIASTSDFRF